MAMGSLGGMEMCGFAPSLSPFMDRRNCERECELGVVVKFEARREQTWRRGSLPSCWRDGLRWLNQPNGGCKTECDAGGLERRREGRKRE